LMGTIHACLSHYCIQKFVQLSI